MKRGSKKIKIDNKKIRQSNELKSTRLLGGHKCSEPGCKNITTDHRCPDCLRKWREKHGVIGLRGGYDASELYQPTEYSCFIAIS